MLRTGAMHSEVHDAPGDALLAPLPLACMAIFAANNWLLKPLYGNWITGKLSDVTACIFMPLVVSALLGLCRVRWPFERRVLAGAVFTAAVLAAVNVSPQASAMLDQFLALVLPLRLEIANTVDPSDLIALPFVLVPIYRAHARKPVSLATSRATGSTAS